MKKIICYLLIIMILTGFAFGQTEMAKSPGSKIIDSLTIGKIELAIPEVGKEVERVTIDNGIVLYLYQSNKLPIFNLSATIRCGGIFDPFEKNGLSGIVGTVLRTGGSKTITGDSLNIIMEFMGGSLETWISDERGSASLSVMSKDIDLGLQLFADLIRNPAFPQDKLDLAKADIKNGIKRRDDSPNSVVGRYFANTIYGDHPYGRILEWESVKGITPQDLIDYHQRYFVPNNIMIAISGDFDKAGIIEKIKKYFGDWQKSDQPLPPYPEVKTEYHPGVYQVWKDINQAYMKIGHLGIKRDNPDRYAIQLVNYILGGGSFTSRLTSRVRSDEGLAYHVSSSFYTGGRDLGAFGAECQTKSATAYKATKLITDEIKRIRDESVTEDELEDARDATINRLVFEFDSPHKIVTALTNLEYDGYPMDYYNGHFDRFRKITRDDIKRVAQKYLQPDKLTYIIVGKPETFEKPLDEFGKVTNIQIAPPVIE
jgi:predicted Zn-dependent peptidase